MRLIAGVVFLFFGILHLIHPENFKNILIATEIPMIHFNLLFVPIVEAVVGILFLLGLFTRLAGIVGVITMGIATWSTLALMKLTPQTLPDGIKEVPFSPPVFIPIIIGVFSLYLLIMGAGAWGIDSRSKK
ncbi:MAG: DoxX family protein [Simkaniaceae bacterium]|nr:MAG: DoxX family protein [Simkaniaceae bacterium]